MILSWRKRTVLGVYDTNFGFFSLNVQTLTLKRKGKGSASAHLFSYCPYKNHHQHSFTVLSGHRDLGRRGGETFFETKLEVRPSLHPRLCCKARNLSHDGARLPGNPIGVFNGPQRTILKVVSDLFLLTLSLLHRYRG